MFQLQLFFLLNCDEWDRVVALPRHKFVTGATLLQLTKSDFQISWNLRFPPLEPETSSLFWLDTSVDVA